MDEVFPQGIVDLSLRVRQTRTEAESLQREVINNVDLFCMLYERKSAISEGLVSFSEASVQTVILHSMCVDPVFIP